MLLGIFKGGSRCGGSRSRREEPQERTVCVCVGGGCIEEGLEEGGFQ